MPDNARRSMNRVFWCVHFADGVHVFGARRKTIVHNGRSGLCPRQRRRPVAIKSHRDACDGYFSFQIHVEVDRTPFSSCLPACLLFMLGWLGAAQAVFFFHTLYLLACWLLLSLCLPICFLVWLVTCSYIDLGIRILEMQCEQHLFNYNGWNGRDQH